MSLFTTTQVINDGTDDFTYDHLGQIPSRDKSVVSRYTRTGSENLDSFIEAKYAYTTSPKQKSVIKTNEIYVDGDGNRYPITFNTSVAHDKIVPLDVVETLFNRHEAALAISGVRTAFLAKRP